MEYRILKCPTCGTYLGKIRMIKTPVAEFLVEVTLKCRSYGRCKLAEGPKRGEAIFDISTAKETK